MEETPTTTMRDADIPLLRLQNLDAFASSFNDSLQSLAHISEQTARSQHKLEEFKAELREAEDDLENALQVTKVAKIKRVAPDPDARKNKEQWSDDEDGEEDEQKTEKRETKRMPSGTENTGIKEKRKKKPTSKNHTCTTLKSKATEDAPSMPLKNPRSKASIKDQSTPEPVPESKQEKIHQNPQEDAAELEPEPVPILAAKIKGVAPDPDAQKNKEQWPDDEDAEEDEQKPEKRGTKRTLSVAKKKSTKEKRKKKPTSKKHTGATLKSMATEDAPSKPPKNPRNKASINSANTSGMNYPLTVASSKPSDSSDHPHSRDQLTPEPEPVPESELVMIHQNPQEDAPEPVPILGVAPDPDAQKNKEQWPDDEDVEEDEQNPEKRGTKRTLSVAKKKSIKEKRKKKPTSKKHTSTTLKSKATEDAPSKPPKNPRNKASINDQLAPEPEPVPESEREMIHQNPQEDAPEPVLILAAKIKGVAPDPDAQKNKEQWPDDEDAEEDEQNPEKRGMKRTLSVAKKKNTKEKRKKKPTSKKHTGMTLKSKATEDAPSKPPKNPGNKASINSANTSGMNSPLIVASSKLSDSSDHPPSRDQLTPEPEPVPESELEMIHQNPQEDASVDSPKTGVDQTKGNELEREDNTPTCRALKKQKVVETSITSGKATPTLMSPSPPKESPTPTKKNSSASFDISSIKISKVVAGVGKWSFLNTVAVNLSSDEEEDDDLCQEKDNQKIQEKKYDHKVEEKKHDQKVNKETIQEEKTVPELPRDILHTINQALNAPLEALVIDGEFKQQLLEAISALQSRPLPDSVKEFAETVPSFIQIAIERVPSLLADIATWKAARDEASAEEAQLKQQLENFEETKAQVLPVINLAKEHLQKQVQAESEAAQTIKDLEAQLLKARRRLDKATKKKEIFLESIAEGEQTMSEVDKQIVDLTDVVAERATFVASATGRLEKVAADKVRLVQQQEDLKMSLRSLLG